MSDEWSLGRRVRTRRGEIAYEVLGTGPPVVLVHGTPSRSHLWRHVARALADRHQVFAFDLLGFGASERRVDQDVRIAAHAEVLAELVAAWGLERPALVAHDIGGAVALRAHLLEGVPVSRLVLVDAVVLRPWITPRTRRMQRELARYAELPDPALAELIAEHLRSATAGPLAPDTFAALFDQWDGAEGQALYLRNLAQLDERDTEAFEPLLTGLTVPTRVVWGEQDSWLPVAVSEQIVESLPDADRVLVPGAGHFAMEDDPDAVARAVGEFLAAGVP